MVTRYINHNTRSIKKKRANLEEDFLAGGTDVGRTGHNEDYGCSNLFWSFTKYRHHNANANKQKKRKANFEDLLAGGTEDMWFS